MLGSVFHKGVTYKVDFFQPIDISIPLSDNPHSLSAWHVPPVKIEPVRSGDWIGDVSQGGSVNFRNITFNAHGNGTHTECVGHISKEPYTINQCLKRFLFVAELITVLPDTKENGDTVITRRHMELMLEDRQPEALVIRSLSNPPAKMQARYSNSNPTYIEADALAFIVARGIDHLLFDMPSVDREQDEGKLLGHRAFWEYPHNTQAHRTITELIYVPNTVMDGTYLLQLQIASFESDASPSKPVLYKVL